MLGQSDRCGTTGHVVAGQELPHNPAPLPNQPRLKSASDRVPMEVQVATALDAVAACPDAGLVAVVGATGLDGVLLGESLALGGGRMLAAPWETYGHGDGFLMC